MGDCSTVEQNGWRTCHVSTMYIYRSQKADDIWGPALLYMMVLHDGEEAAYSHARPDVCTLHAS
jgi:hypothetical protein